MREEFKEHPRPPEAGMLSVPKDMKEQPVAGKAARSPEFGKSSQLDKNGVVLAERLVTQAAVFFNSSYGVELILEKGSLEQTVEGKVSVKPDIRLVTCSRERDTSR